MKTISVRKKIKKDRSEGKITAVEPSLKSMSTLRLYESLKSKLLRKPWTFDGVPRPSLREQLDRYLGDINTSRESDLCDSTSMRKTMRERFFIATAHKAKGLEFESVVVFNATEGAYPYYYNIKNNDQEHIREDARRFYVALSRAKQHLCVTYSSVNAKGYSNKITPFMKAIADRFTAYAFDPETGRLAIIQDSH